jgi:hypothetical protein
MTRGVHPCINCNLYITRSACRSRLWNVSKDLEYSFSVICFSLMDRQWNLHQLGPVGGPVFSPLGLLWSDSLTALCHLGNGEIDEFFPFSMQTAALYINFFSWGSIGVVHPFLYLK